MGKIKVNKNDFYRVLLTETLPYEVPITFLNEGLYKYFIEDYENKKDKTKQEIKNNNFVNKFIDFTEYTKPYNYRIHKNSKSKRLLSIPHASIQKKYSRYL
ncbi:hypothetical protein TUM17384_13690 [Shewanella algae]|nr:hypothetical protein TUM17384_13690 [Shewanella algae]